MLLRHKPPENLRPRAAHGARCRRTPDLCHYQCHFFLALIIRDFFPSLPTQIYLPARCLTAALLRTVLSRRLSGALHRRRWRAGKGGGRDELRVPDQAPLPNRPDHPAPLWPRGLERGREEQAALTRSLVVAESIQTCKTRALCCWWGRFYSRARRRWRALSSLGACRRVDEESKCS